MNHADRDVAMLMTFYTMQGSESERDETTLMEMLLRNRNDY